MRLHLYISGKKCVSVCVCTEICNQKETHILVSLYPFMPFSDNSVYSLGNSTPSIALETSGEAASHCTEPLRPQEIGLDQSKCPILLITKIDWGMCV